MRNLPELAKTPITPEHLTDLGNARRFVSQHGEDVRYCHPWKKWLIWDGKRWRKDDTGEIERRAKATVASIYEEAATAPTDRERKELARWAMESESKHRIKAMISLAESEPGIPVLPEQLDADPWLLNVENGTLDLRSGKLRPHLKEDYITKLCPVPYDPEAECPVWETFLERVTDGNQNLKSFLKRAAGYSLTGDTSEECLFMPYGPGRNGKSKFLGAIEYILGDYARQMRPEVLLEKRYDMIPNDIAALHNVRFTPTIETTQNRRLAESLIKQLTGGDTISARFLRSEFFEFRPQFKIWLATNHKPVVKGTDVAIWERILLIPFTVYIPPPERDKQLLEKFKAEAAGILRWAVEGCLEWQANGLQVPDEVRAATEEYRNEMDTLGDFLTECCVIKPDAVTTAGNLYREYCTWCERTGEKILSQKQFGMLLSERGFERLKSHGKHCWRGIGLLTSGDPWTD